MITKYGDFGVPNNIDWIFYAIFWRWHQVNLQRDKVIKACYSSSHLIMQYKLITDRKANRWVRLFILHWYMVNSHFNVVLNYRNRNTFIYLSPQHNLNAGIIPQILQKYYYCSLKFYLVIIMITITSIWEYRCMYT